MAGRCCRALVFAALAAFVAQVAFGQSILTVAGGASNDNEPATSIGFVNPNGVAVDRSGNLYIASPGENRIRKVNLATGIITTAVGTGTNGFTGDGGLAIEAQIQEAAAVCLDRADNLYIPAFDSVRRVDATTGIISTFAGQPDGGGFAGDGGPATQASLNRPGGIVQDDRGDFYVADGLNSRVRKIDGQTGIITTFAGTGVFGNSGDGGLAAAATFGFPSNVVSRGGSLYVSDSAFNVVRRIDIATGRISAFAGNGTRGFSGDGGPATAAQLDLDEGTGTQEIGYSHPTGLGLDSQGNLYIADLSNSRVRRVDAQTGVISTFAGGGSEDVADGGTPALDVALCCPSGLAIDASDNVYLSDIFYWRVHVVDAKTQMMRPVAGGGDPSPGDGGPAAAAIFFTPTELGIDRSGNLLVVDPFTYRIRKVDRTSGTVSRLLETDASPLGLTVGSDGVIYFASADGPERPTIRQFNPTTGEISLLAGNGTRGFSPDGTLATAAALNFHAKDTECCLVPVGIALDAAGDIVFSEAGNYRIRKISRATGRLSTVAGTGQASSSPDGLQATAASLYWPSALAFDASGNLFVGETTIFTEVSATSYKVRKIDASSGVLSTAAGTGVSGWGDYDIPPTESELSIVRDLAFDKSGNLLISDGPRIRKIDFAANLIRDFAGSRERAAGFGDDGPATRAWTEDMWGLAVDPSNGDVFMVDTSNNRVRTVPACRAVGATTLQSPANAATGTSSAPMLSWSAADAAFRYDLYLDTGSAATLLAGGLKGTSYTPSNLLPGTRYAWRVVVNGDPYCPSPSTRASSTFTFTTSATCGIPGSFTATSPANGATVSGTSVTLQWTSSAGAGTYDVHLGQTSPPRLASSTQSTSATLNLDSGSGSYNWYVVAHASCDATLTRATPVSTFTASGGTGCATPGAFSIVSPPSGAVDVSSSATLQWTASTGVSTYDLYLGTTNPPPLFLNDLAATSFTVSGLLAGKTHYWKVSAKSGCDPLRFADSSLQSFTTRSGCETPGTTGIVFTPPGAVAAGQTYVIAWAPASSLDAEGLYEVQRSADSSFASIADSQLVEATAASFIATQAGTYHHRVRAVAGCDPTRTGAFSSVKAVTVVAGSPNVIFTVQPPGVITELGQPLEDKRASFTIENISGQTVSALLTSAQIASPPFFTIYDRSGGDGVFVTLEPRIPKTFDLRFSGPPNNTQASYQGVIVVIPLSGSKIVPYAFVNLKIGNSANAAPEIRVGGIISSYAFFPAFSGDDATRPPLTISVRNPGTSTMELAAEIGPEVWIEPEAGWNAQPIAAGATRDVKLYTRRARAPNGSALPRYTYLTLRTRTGGSARLLVQDNESTTSTLQRSPLGDPRALSYIVPDVVADPSGGQVSQIRISNVGSDSVQVALYFTPRDADGFSASAVGTATVLVPGNDIVTLTDPVAQIFQKTGAARGQVEVRAATEKTGLLTVSSSIVVATQPERRVAEIPVFWRSEGATPGVAHSVAGVTSDSAQRTELVLVETTGVESVNAAITLVDSANTVRGQMSVTVPRYGHVVVPDVAASLAGGASLTAARLQVAVQSGGGRLVAIAKIVDRTLGSVAVLVGQPEAGVAAGKRAWMRSMLGLQEPEATGAASYLIPLVASGVSGASGSTLVGLSSSLGTATSVQLTLHPSTGSTIVKTVSLAPGTSLEYKDILRELFATTLPIRGSVSVAAADGVRVYSRSLAVPVGGTTAVTAGENPVISLGSQLIVGALPGAVRPIYLDGLSQSVDPTRGSRCSVLISEGAGRQGVVTVRLYEAGNRQVPVAEKDISVPAFGTVPLETIFGALGLESDSRKKDRTNVMCAVVPKNGQALVAAVGVLQDTETGQLRSVAFQPSGGSRPSGTSLAGAVGPEPPSRRRPIRR